MKLTNTQNLKRKSGMTLLELTVVILVLLSLISILFIGARAWKKGSDRAANILNVRNVQQAVRAHANVRGLATPNESGGGGATITTNTEIIGTGLYLNAVTPPSNEYDVEEYDYLGSVPAVGEIYVTNADLDSTIDGEYFYGTSEAAKTSDW